MSSVWIDLAKAVGHPEWEDAIDWVNLLDYRQRMLNACAGLNGGQIK